MTWFTSKEGKRRGGGGHAEAVKAESGMTLTTDGYIQQLTAQLRPARHPDYADKSYYDVLLMQVKENALFKQSFAPDEQDSAARFILRQHMADKVKGFAGGNDFDDFITRDAGQLYTEMTHGLDRKLNMPSSKETGFSASL